MVEIDICAAVADNGNRLSRFGCRARTPGMGKPCPRSAESFGCTLLRRNPMKRDVDDIPMSYLLYVLLAIAVMVGIAAVVIIRLI
jgi:hypothetical protein